MEEAVAGLEKEEAALTVEIVGSDSKDPKTLAFPQEFLFPRVHPMVRGCLIVNDRERQSAGVKEWQCFINETS